MNAVFLTVFCASALALVFTTPNEILPCLTEGAGKSVSLTLSLLGIYAVWMGVLGVANKAGLTRALAKTLSLPIKKMFGGVDKSTCELLSTNISANLLGMGGIATPTGILSAEALDKSNNLFGMNMLLVLSSTSLQLLPTTVISLRALHGSQSPADIFLPTLIATALSTALGAFLLILIGERRRR